MEDIRFPSSAALLYVVIESPVEGNQPVECNQIVAKFRLHSTVSERPGGNRHMREYKINKTWFLALLVAFMFLVGGCDESSHAQAAIKHRTRTATATATATRTATATPTRTATATPTATPTSIPVVVSSNPPSTGCAGQGVPINSKIVVGFNQPMNSSTIIATSTFLVAISPPGTGSIAGVVTYDATNNIGIFTPSSLLLPSTTYKVT